MFKNLIFQTSIVLASAAFSGAAIAVERPSPKSILEFVDGARKPGQSATLLITVTTVSRDGAEARRFRLYDNGADKSIVEFLDPRYRGQKVLSTPQALWFYSPRIHKAIKIPISQRLFGEANFGDVVQLRLLHDYNPDYHTEDSEPVNGQDCWKLVLRAKESRATYKEIVLWVAKSSLAPIKAYYFLASGKHIKTADFVAPKVEKGTLLNDHWVLREPGSDSKHTAIRIDDVAAIELDDHLFTVADLEQAR